MSTEPPMEYLSTPRPPRQQARAAVWVLLAGILTIGAAFAWWSDASRTRTNDRLVAAVVAADQRSAAGEARVRGMLAYASPRIWSTEVSEEVRRDLRALVEETAASVVADLDRVRRDVVDATVLPWNAEQARVRSDLVALVEAQSDRFAWIALDARAIGDAFGTPLPSSAGVRSALRASGSAVGPFR